ncbi:unnamed protein product [Symbiodinium sp. CCMP2456]|nr:unnamed protein product [Symbiodinium sp. CCMP2456]
MRSKREGYLASLLHLVALLPSTSLFLVCLQCLLQRMREGWRETEFTDYFIKEYLYTARVQPAIYGVEEVLTARWFYGLSSPLASGHCPTWQTTEQSHRQFKRALTDAAQRTLLMVLESVKETVDLWSSERTTEENAYALFCPPGNMASRPTRPDKWMVSGKLLHTVRVPGQQVTMLPTIKRLLEDWARHPDYIIEKNRGDRRYFMMRTGKPEALPHADMIWSLLQMRHLDRLRELLREARVLAQTEEGHDKLCREELRNIFLRHCVVLHTPALGDAKATTTCSCFFARRRAHCPHSYAVQQKLELHSWIQPVLPAHRDVPRRWASSAASDGSSVATRPEGRRRKRKKQRPQYRPMPVPVDPVAAPLPAVENNPRGGGRVLPPQRAARSVFNRS